MKRHVVLCFLVIALTGGGRASAPAAVAGRVLFDVDFTQGISQLPAGTQVIGGEWRGGWRVTDNGQRIVFDAGHAIRNGILEVTMTRWDVSGEPMAYLQPALNWRTMPVGLYERETLGKSTGIRGDVLRVQVGNHEKPRGIQGLVRAAVEEDPSGGWMQEFGKWADWVCDDHTPQTLKLEWRDGVPTVHDVTGKAWPSGKTKQIDKLRYVALGGDTETEGSALGVRYLRARLIDYDLAPQPPQLSVRQREVFAIDFTKGADALPTSATVLGGAWDEGWRVTDNHQRIIIDPGYAVRNGCLEVTMTRKRAVQRMNKINVLGLYEHAAIDQSDVAGRMFYLRFGMTELSQGKQGTVKIEGAGKWEERFGKLVDWVMDDKTPVTMKLEWKDGTPSLTDLTGKVMACPEDCRGKMDSLRYVVLGGDRYDGGCSLIGLRFLAAKLIDYDAPGR